MALRVVPFGGFDGFSDLPIVGTHFYSQGFVPSLYGMGTQYSMVDKFNSATHGGMGQIHYQDVFEGYLHFQDDAGQIWKEQTPGAYDFTNVRSPDGNGAGMMADQYGNLLYINGSSNNQLGTFDGSSWTDNYQSLDSGQHPMTWYEDLRLIANNNKVACLFSDGTYSDSAFTLPTNMTITAIKAGPTGILIGANLDNQGAIILWDGNSPRSKVPWKWTPGGILAIDTYGENWIVKTQRQAIVTNGMTVSELFGVFDDPLSFNNYDNTHVLPQQMLLVNGILIFTITTTTSNTLQYGKMKPGVYLYLIARKAWAYIPVPTGETFNLFVTSLAIDISGNRITVGYHASGVNHIAALVPQPPSQATFISEQLGLGRIKYQRLYFGPTDKTLEAVVLNLGILNSSTASEAISFNVSLKIYNFKRQLWGHIQTSGPSSAYNQLIVDATVAGVYDAQVGDEVTILEGVNAGFVAHITAIANDGANNETWTLDTSAANYTEVGNGIQVQPFIFVKRQTFTSLEQLKNIFFSVNSIKGKQFLVKLVFDGIQSGLGIELLTSYWVFNDIGYTQT
ncbi:MAG TPA: hypothetical protein VGG72_21475 [Bryobacteraceae bacterium]|jgi:hypothetical protein